MVAPAVTAAVLKQAPFFWGDNGAMLTPAQAAAQQQVANSLMLNEPAPQNVGQGLAAVGRALVARKLGSEASSAIDAGTKQASTDLQSVLADPTKAGAFLANDPYASEGQKAVAQAILGQQMLLTNPDAIAQRANLASETAKNTAEAGMFKQGGAAIGSPIQDANGNYYVGTQYGDMRPVSPGGAPQAPAPTDLGGNGAAALSQGATSVVAPVDGATVPAVAAAPANPQFLTPAQQEAAKALATKTAGIKADLPKEMVAAKTALDQLDQSDALVNGFIDQALTQANGLSTGMVGKLSEAVPGTPSYQLARTLDTVKANIGFDKLNAMRAASPSGGALGQVSNFEEQLLQSVLGSLDQGQDKGTIVANLNRLKGFLASNTSQRKAAFEADFGGVTPLNGDASFNNVSAAPPQAPAADAPIFARNPQTGQRLQLVNGQWAPVQ